MALLAEEGIGALAATTTAAVIAARLARTVGLADLLLTVTGMALEAWLAFAAATATAVVTTRLGLTIRLATTGVHALVLFAALACGAGTTGTTTAVTAAGLAVAVWYTSSALTAVQGLDVGDTLIVPLRIAAPGIVVADALLNGGIVAAAVLVGCTTIAGAGAGTAVARADLARLTAIAFAIATYRVGLAACAALQRGDFVDANSVPLHLAAEGIFVAYASRDSSVVAGGSTVCLAATSAAALATVRRTDQTVFVVVAGPVATSSTDTIAAVERSNFLYADFVPGELAAE